MDYPFDGAIVMTLDKRLVSRDATAVWDFSNLTPPLAPCFRSFIMGDGVAVYPTLYDHVDVEASPRRQAYNYAVAMQKAVALAKKNGWGRFLYLEDDAVPVADFSSQFQDAWGELNESVATWDLLYIGGKHINVPTWPISPRVVRSFYSLDMHCLGISASAYDKILAITPSAEATIDGIIAEKQRRGEFLTYAFRPCLALQKEGWSFNENRYTDRSAEYDRAPASR